MLICLAFKKIKIDDPLESFQVYCTAGFWGMFASLFFWPEQGIFWKGKDSGTLLGIQLLGFTAVSLWTIMISWIYFFSLKRSKTLKLKKSEEILGFDALQSARAKGIMIDDLL